MNTRELEDLFHSKGCNPGQYAITNIGTKSDLFCLIQRKGKWQICYSERGCFEPPIFESLDEHAACERYAELILQQRHDHLVGLFTNSTNLEAITKILESESITFHSDSIPLNSHTKQFRLFIYNDDIFKAQSLWPNLPLDDDTIIQP